MHREEGNVTTEAESAVATSQGMLSSHQELEEARNKFSLGASCRNAAIWTLLILGSLKPIFDV